MSCYSSDDDEDPNHQEGSARVTVPDEDPILGDHGGPRPHLVRDTKNVSSSPGVCNDIMNLVTLLSSYNARRLQTFKKIHKCYFPTNISVKPTDASAELGRQGIQPTPEAIKDMILLIQTDQQDLRSWARHQIHGMMCDEANARHMTHGTPERNVQRFKDIRDYFKANSSTEALENVWQVCYGTFDRHQGWAKKLADDFMSEHGWEYTPDTPPKVRTFCVERQIALCKGELIKSLNAAVQKTHGLKVRISRLPEQITEKNKFEKRTKSVFKAQYIATRVSTILILFYLLIHALTPIIVISNIHIA